MDFNMKKTLVVLLTAVLLFVVAPSPAANAGETSDWWKTYATAALNKFSAGDNGNMDSFTYGMATGASAYLNGWNATKTTNLLNDLRQTKNPDGTYGLGRTYDAFADGSVNPATTAYSVTMAGHVGFTLLEGYKAGVVPKAEVQDLVAKLVNFPRVPVDKGACIAYSNAATDDTQCVHNVNSTVAWFLHEANSAGIGATGMQRFISEITIQEVLAYKDTDFWWPYIDDGANQDSDHNSASAEGMYRLTYWIGREAAYNMMTHDYSDISSSPIVYIRLAGLPGGPGSWSNSTTMTLWCDLANSRRTSSQAYLTSASASRAAQIAYYAGRAVGACNLTKPKK